MDSPRVLSLFTGIGGLDLGIRMALPQARVVCGVEREYAACQVLAARMEDGSLERFPVWSDVTTFDGTAWRGAVDLICGGFPCQDISCAGKGEGLEGSRSGLWYEFARIIGEVGPRYVFVENVSMLLVRGLDQVLGTLSELGFDAEWTTLRASDVGAPHRRERVFILAHRNGAGLEGRWERGGELQGGRERTARSGSGELAPRDIGGRGGTGAGVGDTEQPRRTATGERCDEHAGAEPEAGSGGGVRCNARKGGSSARGVGKSQGGSEGSSGTGSTSVTGQPANARSASRQDRPANAPSARGSSSGVRRECFGDTADSLPLWPPGPGDRAGWEWVLERWPWLAPAVEPEVRGVAVRLPSRVDQLRALGNCVVPQCAAAAFRILWGRMNG